MNSPLVLEDLRSPLRHYTVTCSHDVYVFTHRVSGHQLRVGAACAHERWQAMPKGSEPIQAFEQLLPRLCHRCGERSENGLCGPCTDTTVSTLRDLLR